MVEEGVAITPLVTDGKPYEPPIGMKEEVTTYLKRRLREYFQGRRHEVKFVGSTIREILENVPGSRLPSQPEVWIDIGLRESLDLNYKREQRFEKGLKEIGRKYGVLLEMHPLSYGK